MAQIIMAMDYWQLGERDLARQTLGIASEAIKQAYDATGTRRNPDNWFDWEFNAILHDEAAELIGVDKLGG